MQSKRRITRWEYLQQSCREIFHDRGIDQLPPRDESEWNDLYRNEAKVVMEASYRMGDLFYNCESDTFRDYLNPKESLIALRPDLTHEVRKTRIYILRCRPYLMGLDTVDIAKVAELFASALSSDPERELWSAKAQLGHKNLQFIHKWMKGVRNRGLEITDEDKRICKCMGIVF
jgi:hypothetical protein